MKMLYRCYWLGSRNLFWFCLEPLEHRRTIERCTVRAGIESLVEELQVQACLFNRSMLEPVAPFGWWDKSTACLDYSGRCLAIWHMNSLYTALDMNRVGTHRNSLQFLRANVCLF